MEEYGMTESERRFWPFKRRTSIIVSVSILIGLLVFCAILRKAIDWPGKESETTMLIGMMVFSMLPVLLAFIDVIVERGGVIGYGNFKIDFSKIPKWGASEFTVPVNIGLPNQSVDSSSIQSILKALKNSTACDVLIIDLKDGQAWWETRLLILLAGAVRLKKPEKVVFVGKESEIDKSFLGWSHPHELLHYLLESHPQYARIYYVTKAISRQWELAEPVGPGPAQPRLPFAHAGQIGEYSWMAFDTTTGLPNELFAVQLLATELGKYVETQEKEKVIKVNCDRLNELFGQVLRKEIVDESWQLELQISRFFDADVDYLAITQNKKYSKLVSRLTVLNAVVRILVEKK